MTRLFIGNIPHGSSQIDLQQWIEARGFHVEAAEIVYDRVTGKSRGFGFVTVGEAEGVDAIVSVLNGQRMNGRVLTVNHAVPLSAGTR